MQKLMTFNGGQVWVETIVYTLIGIGLMAVVLTYLVPKVNQSQERSVIEQTLDMLNIIDIKIHETMENAPGSTRVIPALSLKKGSILIDGGSNKIKAVFDDLKYEYSEPGAVIPYGRVNIKTEKTSKGHTLTLEVDPGYDVQYRDEDIIQIIPPSPTPYKLLISNKNGKVNFEEISGK